MKMKIQNLYSCPTHLYLASMGLLLSDRCLLVVVEVEV